MASQYDLVVIGGGTARLGSCRRYEVVGRESRLAGWRDSFRERMFKAGVSGEQNKAAGKESPE